MKKFLYHANQYFKLNTALPALYFAVLYLLVTIISTPLIMAVIDPLQIEGLMTGEVLRLELMPRLAFASYEFILIPLYLKRMLDMGWSRLQREFGVLILILPVMLVTFFSEGAYFASSEFIGFLRILALTLTVLLFVWPTQKKGA
tara:strand:- start:28604 stop:29038 length:435 start_codon:yes stop_codon:yes gene_type:complete